MDEQKFKICPKCNTQNNEDAKFCISCGFDIKSIKPETIIKNGAFINTENTSIVITKESIPSGYKSTALVFSSLNFDATKTDISTTWSRVVKNLKVIATSREIDGVANVSFQIVSLSNNVLCVAISGEGIKKEEEVH